MFSVFNRELVVIPSTQSLHRFILISTFLGARSELNLIIRFADTELEHYSLYYTIELAQNFCDRQKIPFEIVKGKQSYWYIQFALGYPVPDFRVRWCTGKLKIQPMQPSRKLKSITGRHFGESKVRDNRLKNTCGASDTCGIDKINKSYDPIIHYSNCLIWDSLFYFDGTVLYSNVFVDRRLFWDKLSSYFDYLLGHNWLKVSDILAITESLKSDYSYPPTYTQDWIDFQHKLLSDN